jgi:hypothetical protein
MISAWSKVRATNRGVAARRHGGVIADDIATTARKTEAAAVHASQPAMETADGLQANATTASRWRFGEAWRSCASHDHPRALSRHRRA